MEQQLNQLLNQLSNQHTQLTEILNAIRRNADADADDTDDIIQYLKSHINFRKKYAFVTPEKSLENCDCPICLSSIPMVNSCKTSCQHFYCKTCLSKWREQSIHCPLCQINYNDLTYFVKNKWTNPVYNI
jgi:hypothetical protein